MPRRLTRVAACLFVFGALGASGHDAVKTTLGIAAFGDVLPALQINPAITELGVDAPPSPGPDRIEGFDRNGKRVFSRTFADDGYSYAVFVPLAKPDRDRLDRLQVTVAKKTATRTAAPPAPPAARARLLADGKVEVMWDAAHFPRLSCIGGPGSSPAPFMLHGSFVLANELGKTLRCEFSDGVKTTHSNVAVPIAGR